MLQAAVGTLLVCARQRRRWCGADQDHSRTTLGTSLLRRTGGGRRRDAAPRSARAGASPAPRWRPTHRVRRLPLTSGAQADSRSGQDQSTSSGRDARPRHSTLCPYVTSAAHGAVAISGCGRVCTMRSIVGIIAPRAGDRVPSLFARTKSPAQCKMRGMLCMSLGRRRARCNLRDLADRVLNSVPEIVP